MSDANFTIPHLGKPNNNSNPTSLTAEQKTKILETINLNPQLFPSIKELTEILFPGKNLDGRSPEGRMIKEYLATLNVKQPPNKYSQEIKLSDEQQLYIKNNASTMSISEMGRALFNKENITKNILEYKVIERYLESINITAFDPNNSNNTSIFNVKAEFSPKTLDQAARKVNKYVRNAIDTKSLKKDTRTQNYLFVLIKYCHKTRYSLMMSTLSNTIDLELFESTFISNVWDKPDLSEEEVDQYINLCCDIVNYTRMQREVEKLSEMRDRCLDDSDGKRLSMALVAQMGELYKEMDNNLKRQNATTKVLIGTRNDRMEGRLKENASVLQLVEAWRDQQKRERLLKLADLRKALIRDEINQLDNLDAFKAEIFGLNKEAFQ